MKVDLIMNYCINSEFWTGSQIIVVIIETKMNAREAKKVPLQDFKPKNKLIFEIIVPTT